MAPAHLPPKSESPASVAPPIWRRIFHATSGTVLAVAAIFLPTPAVVTGFAILAALSLALDLLRFRVPGLNRHFLRWLAPLLKSDEGSKLTGATFMLLAGLFSFLVFDHVVAVTALLFLALGDPAAALLGYRGRIPRFLGKSPWGTAAFIGVSAVVVMALAGTGVIELHWRWFAGAVVAGLVETAPIPIDDNLTVPLAGGAVIEFLPALA